MLVELPLQLQRALDAQRAGLTDAELARATRALSERYRQEPVDFGSLIRSDADVAAYATYRAPATYAAIVATLSALREVWPTWQPRSLFDFGAGLGSGLWAATQIWPGIDRMLAHDASPLMIETGRALCAASTQQALHSAEWRQAGHRQLQLDGSFDLSLLSYVVGEIEPESVDSLLERVWNATSGVLVVIEPGTPAGSRLIERVRDQIIRQGGFALAPCPHDPPCRVAEDDWTHFSVRLPRRRSHQVAKEATLNYEDEKYSFVVLAHEALGRTYSRVLRHPQTRKGHIYLQLCTTQGIETVVVSKREGTRYSRARKAQWGDIFAWDE